MENNVKLALDEGLAEIAGVGRAIKKEAYSIVLPKDTFLHLQGERLEVVLSPWIGLDGIVICKNEGPEVVAIELDRVD